MGSACTVFAGGAAGSTGGYFDDFPVVLSASRMMQTVDQAPAAVTVIDREMIRASGARELVDVFRLIPGMVVGQYKGHQPTLGFHGFSDPYFRQLQVLVDGVSIYSPVWGGVEWSQLAISIEDVERIEVVRGPNAATFGTNSFLGVVNIITRDPAVESGGEVLVRFGENGIRDEQVRYSVNQGDFRQRLTAGQSSDNGLNSFPDTRRSSFFNLRGHYRLSSTDEFRWQAGYVGGRQDQGVYATPNHTDGARTARFDAGSAQLRWTRAASVDDEFWIQLSHSERSHREMLPYQLIFPQPFGTWNYPLDFSYKYHRTDLEMQHGLRLAESVRGVWGAQIRQDQVHSQTYFHTDSWQLINLYRLFGNLEWRPTADWGVAGGAMLEKSTTSATSLSPSIAVNYRVALGHTVRLRMASAKRSPTLYEDRFDWYYDLPPGLRDILAGMPAPYSTYATMPLIGSIRTQEDLEDERIRSREMSYMGKFPKHHLNLELHIFQHHLDRLLGQYKYSYPTVWGSIDPMQPSRYSEIAGFGNIASATIKGQSVAITWRPLTGSLVYLAGSHTRIHAEGGASDQIENSGPRNTLSVLLSQELRGDWRISTAYYRVGEMATLSGGDHLPPTERIDVSVAKHFHASGFIGELALTVSNANGGIPVFEEKDVDERTAWLLMRIGY